MKKAIQISLILITFSLLSVSYLLTLVSAEGQFADPDCAPGAAHPELCDDHTDGGPGHNPGGGFVDPD